MEQGIKKSKANGGKHHVLVSGLFLKGSLFNNFSKPVSEILNTTYTR